MGKDVQPDSEVMGTALRPQPLGPNPGLRQRQGLWAGVLLLWTSRSTSRAGAGGGEWGRSPRPRSRRSSGPTVGGVCAGQAEGRIPPSSISGRWHRGWETSHPVWAVFQALGTEEPRQAWLG